MAAPMPQGPPPGAGGPPPGPGPGGPPGGGDDGGAPQAGGAAQLVANISDGLMKLHDMVSAKFPDEAQELGQIVQAYQSFIQDLSQGPDSAAKGPPQPGTTTPEAGAANVKPAM